MGNKAGGWYGSHPLPLCFTQDKFSACKAEEGGIAVATLTNNNEADGNLGK